MRKRVWACDRCGEEADRDVETCPICGGEIEHVDPVLVAILDAFEAGLSATKEDANE